MLVQCGRSSQFGLFNIQVKPRIVLEAYASAGEEWPWWRVRDLEGVVGRRSWFRNADRLIRQFTSELNKPRDRKLRLQFRTKLLQAVASSLQKDIWLYCAMTIVKEMFSADAKRRSHNTFMNYYMLKEHERNWYTCKSRYSYILSLLVYRRRHVRDMSFESYG